MPGYQCEICGVFMDENNNRTGIKNESGEVMQLCGLHHETAAAVLPDGAINWLAMRLASAGLHDLRPSLEADPDAFAAWDPLAVSIELYRRHAADPAVRRDWQEILAVGDDQDQDAPTSGEASQAEKATGNTGLSEAPLQDHGPFPTLNPFLDEYASLMPGITLPYVIACHRPEDGPLFVDDAAFERASQAQGWSDSHRVYTCGRRLLAPTGLVAFLVYYRAKRPPELWKRIVASAAGRVPAAFADSPAVTRPRGVDLLLFATGQCIARMRVAHCLLPVGSPEHYEDSDDRLPAGDGPFDVGLARIGADGAIVGRRVSQHDGSRRDARWQSDVLQGYPVCAILKRAVVRHAGQTLAFTEPDLARMEAAIAWTLYPLPAEGDDASEFSYRQASLPVARSVTEMAAFMTYILPIVMDAAAYRYGELTDAVWLLVAATLGLPDSQVRRLAAEKKQWDEEYARMRDGAG